MLKFQIVFFLGFLVAASVGIPRKRGGSAPTPATSSNNINDVVTASSNCNNLNVASLLGINGQCTYRKSNNQTAKNLVRGGNTPLKILCEQYRVLSQALKNTYSDVNWEMMRAMFYVPHRDGGFDLTNCHL